MLKKEDNEILTRVGPGTLMGELLRRYWTPACLSAEIPQAGGAPARVRLLGENLVAFRDTKGRVRIKAYPGARAGRDRVDLPGPAGDDDPAMQEALGLTGAVPGADGPRTA